MLGFIGENTNLVALQQMPHQYPSNGNQYLRYYLVEATNSVRRQIPEYRDYYSKKYQEVPKHQHKRALVLTARKFVRLVDALLRKNQIYTTKGSVIYEA